MLVWQLNEKLAAVKAAAGLGTTTRLASRIAVESTPGLIVCVKLESTADTADGTRTIPATSNNATRLRLMFFMIPLLKYTI